MRKRKRVVIRARFASPEDVARILGVSKGRMKRLEKIRRESITKKKK